MKILDNFYISKDIFKISSLTGVGVDFWFWNKRNVLKITQNIFYFEKKKILQALNLFILKQPKR